MRTALSIFLAFGIFGLTGCAHTNLNRSKVVAIAKTTAIHQGYCLADYKTPRASYGLGGVKEWYVYFQGRKLVPGDYFAVSVDDASGAARIIPGD
jgi:hypothetical protein